MNQNHEKKNHLEGELHYIYSHVNDMLKFGEAKNAGLIGLNFAIVIGIAQILSSTSNGMIQFFCWYIIVLNILSSFFSLIAVYGQLKEKEEIPQIDDMQNLLFFGTLSKLTPDLFLEKLKERYNFQSCNTNFELDMARQIIIVSQIAIRKFRLFNTAMWFTFASMPPLPFMYFIFQKYFNPNK